MINLVLDLDTGIDDAIALSIAAKDKRVNLVGVTCTYGNVTVDESAYNTLALLSLLDRLDIPVYKGSDRALNSTSPYIPHEAGRKIHGKKGSGNIVLKESKRSIENTNAIDYLSSLMMKRDDITIITTGPMTNLASVLSAYPTLSSWKGKVIFMGGALTVRGNVNHFAEANIFKDPEAAKIVVESGLDVTMIGLDVTERTRLYRKDAEKWKNKGNEIGETLGSMLDYYLDNTLDLDETYVHDPSAVIASLHPEYFSFLPLPLTVETEGIDRGRVVLDEKRLLDRDKMVNVALDVDRVKLEEFLSSFDRYL
ncbi:MAG: nucleoside hydrolase [Spirochaetales bacterium]|nr:nucleoside hydrolase [Spirochaetales bacterium]